MPQITCVEENGGQALDYFAPLLMEADAALVVCDFRDHGNVRVRELFIQDHGELFFDLYGKKIARAERCKNLCEATAAKSAGAVVLVHYYLHSMRDLVELSGATVQVRHGQVNGCLVNSRRQDPVHMLRYDLFLAESEVYYSGHEKKFNSEKDRVIVVGNIPASYIGKTVVEKGYVPRGRRDAKNVALLLPSLADKHVDQIYRGETFLRVARQLAESGFEVVVRFHPVVRALYVAGVRFHDAVENFLFGVAEMPPSVREKIDVDWRLDSSLKYLNISSFVLTDYSSAAVQFLAHGVPIGTASVREHANFLAKVSSVDFFPDDAEDAFKPNSSWLLKRDKEGVLSVIGTEYLNSAIVEDVVGAVLRAEKKTRKFAKI